MVAVAGRGQGRLLPGLLPIYPFVSSSFPSFFFSLSLKNVVLLESENIWRFLWRFVDTIIERTVNLQVQRTLKIPRHNKSNVSRYRFSIPFPARDTCRCGNHFFPRYRSLSAPEQKGFQSERCKRSEEGLHGRTPAVNFTTSSPGTTSSQNRH